MGQWSERHRDHDRHKVHGGVYFPQSRLVVADTKYTPVGRCSSHHPWHIELITRVPSSLAHVDTAGSIVLPGLVYISMQVFHPVRSYNAKQTVQVVKADLLPTSEHAVVLGSHHTFMVL